MSPFETFFRGIGDGEVVLFTTFTLDEAVLVELLKYEKVSPTQKIVVFHDILRHRNPGFLKSIFHNAMVYTIELEINHPKRCPVFHSKIWARLKINNNKPELIKLVVTSANLSSYHLVQREEGGTLESYKCFEGQGVSLPTETPIFDAAFLFPNKLELQKGWHRCKMTPHSLIIDARAGLNIKSVIYPLIHSLKALGVPEACAAPFVCGNAIMKHLKPTPKMMVYQGTHPKKHLAIHAKVMFFNQCMAMGSVNWTSQAMGCTIDKPINHETLLLVFKDDSIMRALRGFPYGTLINTDLDVPGDQDPEDPIPDWNDERKLRIAAPERALLCMENNIVSIKLTGGAKANTVKLRSLRNLDVGVTVKLQDNIIKQPLNAKSFASIIGKGNVELIGLARGRKVWITSLDYGEYWPILELQGSHVEPKPKPKRGNKCDGSEQRLTNHSDVRDMRQLVIQNPLKGPTMVAFTRWLYHHGLHSMDIPIWCQELARQLAEQSVKLELK